MITYRLEHLIRNKGVEKSGWSDAKYAIDYGQGWSEMTRRLGFVFVSLV